MQHFGELKIESLVIQHFRCDVDDVKNYNVALPSYMAKGLNLSFLEIKLSQIYSCDLNTGHSDYGNIQIMEPFKLWIPELQSI